MKALALTCLVAAYTLQAAQPEKAGPIRPPPPTPPHVYVDPETVPEHDWDRNLFRTDAQVPAIHLEFLYWKALEGGLSYALKMDGPAWGPGNVASCGTYQNATFDIDPGFRIGGSFFRAPHYWEVFAQYTRMTSKGTSYAFAPTEPGQSLNAVWQLPIDNPLSEARSYIHLNYNVADYYFTRYFHPNPHLRIRVIGGFSGTWMNQDMNITYTDIAENISAIDAKWKYWGAGFRFGMMGDWYWFTDLYLTAKLTFAGMMGSYTNEITQQTSGAPTPEYDVNIPFGSSTYKDGRAVTNIQIFLGPSWQKAFKHSRVELFAGCEYNMWTNLQQCSHSILTTPGGSKAFWTDGDVLSMVGLTTRLSVDF